MFTVHLSTITRHLADDNPNRTKRGNSVVCYKPGVWGILNLKGNRLIRRSIRVICTPRAPLNFRGTQS
jgi:hypothetical protein